MISHKNLIKAWDDFFFAPKPVEGIAFFRILFGLFIALGAVFDSFQLTDFYGPHSIISFETVKFYFNYPVLNLFFFLKNDYTTLYVIYTVYWLSIIFMILGLFTRYAMVVLFICMVSFHQRCIWSMNSADLLIRLTMLLMIFSPAGYAYSLDCILAKKYPKFKRPREYAPWVQKMILIQLSAVYVMTVFAKSKGDTWFDGTAVYYATRLEELARFPVPFLLDSMLFIKLITWGTLIVELALGTLIWFDKFRKPLIIAGIVFHIGIEYMMSIPFFEWLMILLLLLFYTPEEYRAFAAKLDAYLRQSISNSNVNEKLKKTLLEMVG